MRNINSSDADLKSQGSRAQGEGEVTQTLAEARINSDELLVMSWNEWTEIKVPPREYMLKPIIPEKGVIEVFAERGIGKTFFALGMAMAMATGSRFLRFKAPKPRRVVYVDGEMDFAELQERAKAMMPGISKTPPGPEYLQLISADRQKKGIPSLGKQTSREKMERALRLGMPDQAECVIFDNRSTLFGSVSEIDADDWYEVQDWFLKLRRAGISIIVVEHGVKTGKTARGSSRREDIMNTVIQLKRPKGYKASEGARFEVHFPKNRGFFGSDADPFEAKYDNGAWTMPKAGPSTKPAVLPGNDENRAKVIALAKQGMSGTQIEKQLGLSHSTVADWIKKARETGELPPKGSKQPADTAETSQPIVIAVPYYDASNDLSKTWAETVGMDVSN